MAQIIGLFRASAPPRPKQHWSNQDLAELYRVEAALVQAGLKIDTERGESDEGDPWFAFCHANGGEVIVHFALIDGEYIVAAPAFDSVLSGPSLDVIVRSFIEENPVSLPSPEEKRNGNVIFHPAALLTVFVATLLLTSTPDQSFAAGARHAAVPEAPMAESEAAKGDSETFDANLDLAPDSNLRVEEAKDSRSNEMALLLTVAVMASEMARFQVEAAELADATYAMRDISVQSINLSAPSNLPQVLEFDNPLDAVQSSVSQDGSVDQISATGSTPSKAATPVIELGKVVRLPETKAGEDQVRHPIESDATVFTLGFDDADPREEVLEISAALLPGEEQPSRQDSGPARKNASTETQTEVVETPRLWLEDQEFSVGLVDRATVVEAEKAIEIVDKGQPDDLSKTDSAAETNKAAETERHWSDRLVEFDEGAQLTINHFLKSDDDIMAVERKDGSVVIFDQSDIKSGQLLKHHIWFFDDKTSIAIVGHADTVSEALGLVV